MSNMAASGWYDNTEAEVILPNILLVPFSLRLIFARLVGRLILLTQVPVIIRILELFNLPLHIPNVRLVSTALGLVR